MAESWEDNDYSASEQAKPKSAGGLNPNAVSWTPSFLPPPTDNVKNAQPFSQYVPQQQQQQQQYQQYAQYAEVIPPPIVSEQQYQKEAVQDNDEELNSEADAAQLSEAVQKVSLQPDNRTAEVELPPKPVKENLAEPKLEKFERKEEAEVEIEEKDLPPPDPREHMNIVFIGHVDAGKSTLSGSILYNMNVVDDRTLAQYKQKAKETNRESWFLAFIMDTNEEERARGKTVEVGRAHFCTKTKRYTILDAPGHKNYVPAMIAGAAQADVGILVISARKGEFEAGFDRLGQTREHAMLAKTLGVQKLVVVINKMDESTVRWSKERFDQIVNKLTPFLKGAGFKVKKHVIFLPISAMTGDNVKIPVSVSTCEWATKLNDNKSLIELLDDMELLGRDPKGPLRIPVLDRYSDRGLNVLGKIESGFLQRGQEVIIVPTFQRTIVEGINAYISKENLESPEEQSQVQEAEVSSALVGENITMRLKDLNEEDVQKGFVICGIRRPMKQERIRSKSFVAQLQILELLPHRSLFTAGYTCVLHVHTAIEDCVVKTLLKEMDPVSGKPKDSKTKVRFVKSNSVVWARLTTENEVCLEPFNEMMPLGRFTLRDEGKTIAIGKVVKVDEVKQENI